MVLCVGEAHDEERQVSDVPRAARVRGGRDGELGLQAAEERAAGAGARRC